MLVIIVTFSTVSLVMVAVECSLHVVTYISHVLPSVFKDILILCYDIWKEADEKEREKRKEEESLYHYKAQTCDITGDEGRNEDKEIELTFPSYEIFFTGENNDSSKSIDKPKEGDYTQFTDVQMEKITCLHSYLYYTSDLPRSNSHLSAYETAEKLYTKLDDMKDWDCVGGHAKMCYLLLEELKLEDIKHNKLDLYTELLDYVYLCCKATI